MRQEVIAASFGALAVLAAGPAYAQARDGMYYGDAGLGFMLEDDFDTFGIVGRGGYEFPITGALREVIDAVAYEGELFIGVNGEEAGSADNRVVYSLSGNARLIKELTPRWDAFARVGIARTRVRTEVFDDEESDGDSDFLFGVGGEFNLSRRNGIRADYTLQNDLQGLMVTYSQKF